MYVEHIVKIATRDSFETHVAIFAMCSTYIYSLWLRNISVSVEMYQLSSRVFICAFRTETFSFFSLRVSSYYSYF